MPDKAGKKPADTNRRRDYFAELARAVRKKIKQRVLRRKRFLRVL